MDELTKEIERLVGEELKRIKAEKGDKFLTLHDGHGVLNEGLEKTQEKVESARLNLKWVWCKIRENDPNGAMRYAQLVSSRALQAAVKAIQLAAEAQKFEDSFKGE